MPPVNVPSSDYLAQQINLMQQQLQALQTQQQYVMVDKNGNLRLQLGLLQNGDYGILMQDASGNHQELLPSVSAFENSALSLTGFGPSTISGSPSVTANIGASGNAKITLATQITLPASGGTSSTPCYGAVLIVIDGSGAYGEAYFGVRVGSAGNSVTGTASVAQVMSLQGLLNGGTLTEGSHTFSLIYVADSGSSSNVTFFSQNYLEVQPI